MPAPWLARLVFVLYCLEAGTFLLVMPWTQIWPRLLESPPVAWVQAWLWEPWIRGAVSGFGAVHLVWAFHDAKLLWCERRPVGPGKARGESPTSETAPGAAERP